MGITVGVNLLWLVPGAAGGAETYATRLLRAVADEPVDDIEITILCNRGFPSAHPQLVERFSTAVAPVDGRSRPARIVAETTWIVREASRRNLRLIHHMNDVLPWFRSRPSALTIHDLRSMAGRRILGPGRAAYLRARMPTSVRRASVIMTPTNYVRNEVVDVLRADADRVVVVPAPVFVRQNPAVRGTARSRDRSFVYPARTDRYKNHAVLLEAFAKLAVTEPDVRLVLTGARGDAEQDVRASIRDLGISDRVDRPGRIPEADLHGLIASAVALVYPSRFEGFGLPIVEAMAAGCPVIAAAGTALPEVVGDAGLLVDPDDVGGWTAALARVLNDDSLRSQLSRAGRERVRSLTPTASAQELFAAYRVAVA
jgi:glycosyltransferase involved in cell wall biosynthesis